MEQHYNQTADLFTEEPVIYAGFWERFGAALIDGIILYVAGLLIDLLIPGAEDDVASVFTRSGIGILINWLYFAFQESGSAQATLGKKALGLKVTSVDGGRISFGQATGRYFGKIISSIILLIGYFMMLWSDKKQTLHDQMAGTLVVKS